MGENLLCLRFFQRLVHCESFVNVKIDPNKTMFLSISSAFWRQEAEKQKRIGEERNKVCTHRGDEEGLMSHR